MSASEGFAVQPPLRGETHRDDTNPYHNLAVDHPVAGYRREESRQVGKEPVILLAA